MRAPGETAIVFRNLTLAYDGRPVVQAVDGAIRCGELLALVGPNGAGKSTLLKSIVGEVRAASGGVDLGGTAVRDIAYLPQRAAIDLAFPIVVEDLVASGLWRRIGGWRRIGRLDRNRILSALDEVGLAGLERRPIGKLSGGQAQRALFARTILQDAEIVLLDEPFAAIDARTSTDLLALVRRWHDEGRTVVAAMHDLYQVRASFPTSLLLAGRAVAWGPTLGVLTRDNLAEARRLLDPGGGRAPDPAATGSLGADA